jgi:hypothetical protein
MNDPLAIMDIKSGINPNHDAKWLSGATSVDPVPSYGCGSVSPGAPTRSGTSIFLSSAVAALVVARKKRRGQRLLYTFRECPSADVVRS